MRKTNQTELNSSPWFKLDTQFNVMRLLQKKKSSISLCFFTSACMNFETIHVN